MSETKKLGKVYEKALDEAYTKAWKAQEKAREALEAYEKVLQEYPLNPICSEARAALAGLR